MSQSSDRGVSSGCGERGNAAAPSATLRLVSTPHHRQKMRRPSKRRSGRSISRRPERIVAVGRGNKGTGTSKIAENLAQAMGAELAASRPICDAGWLPMDRADWQLGQTVAPSCTSPSASQAPSSISSA